MTSRDLNVNFATNSLLYVYTSMTPAFGDKCVQNDEDTPVLRTRKIGLCHCTVVASHIFLETAGLV